MDPDIIIPIAGMITGVILGWPVVRTVTRLIEKKVHGDSAGELEDLRSEVRELREIVEGSHDLQDRILDLEERIDFQDRLLAQGKRPPPAPSSPPSGDS